MQLAPFRTVDAHLTQLELELDRGKREARSVAKWLVTNASRLVSSISKLEKFSEQNEERGYGLVAKLHEFAKLLRYGPQRHGHTYERVLGPINEILKAIQEKIPAPKVEYIRQQNFGTEFDLKCEKMVALDRPVAYWHTDPVGDTGATMLELKLHTHRPYTQEDEQKKQLRMARIA